ncbi:glycoside hydrolase family 3 C-terminal domain-containing protein [Flammeovirga sp. EKP202]|uniref:glycoside hydrolase family 3 C-terminal domain-containing protein n=1 Tax=Flammeovirga sp. EKP202 TaxID=2770592 RepID=UPI00165FFDEB|nr:glycoside hydrolase family 3 C-terminal domain-containing protein [Flammeovirga sp. EKP202]MBD0400991.1 glycoside hydrolase family 3 C-terminal domain-containing protein [Flammeovirga sp. EKP202]
MRYYRGEKLKFLIVLLFFGTNVLAQTDTDKEIDKIIAQMTIDEKVAMCHAQSKFTSAGVPRLGIPEVWMSDGPHGVRAEINWDNWGYAGWTNDSITAFPALTCLAATFDEKASYDYGVAVGEEARYRKKDILLGPGVNIYRTPLNGRNFEYMGEDPHLASKMVVPYIKGVQTNGVAACVKHFVANNQELWRGHINVELSERALREIYLPAFKAAVLEGDTWSMMSAYNQLRGQYCSHNEYLVNTILKGEWGFDGVYLTDWGAAHDTKQSALYGLDIEMGTGTNGLTYSEKNHYENYYLAGAFKELVKSGEVSEEVLDDKVRRILKLIYRTSLSENRPLGSVNTDAHHEVARRVGQQGIVLLQNEDHFFPIVDKKGLKIAVIGENATRMMTIGGGSSELKVEYEISPLQGIQERYPNAEVIHAMGYASGPSQYGRVIPSKLDADVLKAEAIEVAKTADVVLFFGGLNKSHHQDCEDGDRLTYDLPFGQSNLIQAISEVNENIGVVLISGNAVATPWTDQVKGLMQGWYLGSETGHALADVISGDVNPSGKLPITFPKKLEDNGAHQLGEMSYPGDSINVEYKDDILVGYRWHDTKKITPKYAFGYGLSYTDFEISEVAADKKVYASSDNITITCDLRNNGELTGAEVVQVYIGKNKSKVERALKELKAFQKVQLEAGEKTNLSLTVSIKDLQYYNEGKSDWELEKGDYYIYVGNASDNISKRLKITISDNIN